MLEVTETQFLENRLLENLIRVCSFGKAPAVGNISFYG